MVSFNQLCREQCIPFVAVGAVGTTCALFVDFGMHFVTHSLPPVPHDVKIVCVTPPHFEKIMLANIKAGVAQAVGKHELARATPCQLYFPDGSHPQVDVIATPTDAKHLRLDPHVADATAGVLKTVRPSAEILGVTRTAGCPTVREPPRPNL